MKTTIAVTLVLAQAAAFAPAPRARGLTALSSFKVTLVDPSGEQKTFDCPDDETILDAAEEILGLELPASCRSGSCTSCQGRLVKGTVEQEEAHTLEEEHLDAGYVCTCVAYPTSDLTILTHQEEAFEDNDMGPFDDSALLGGAPAPAVDAEPVAEPVIAAAAAPVVVAQSAPAANTLSDADLLAELKRRGLVINEAASPAAASVPGSALRSAIAREIGWGCRHNAELEPEAGAVLTAAADKADDAAVRSR